MGGSAVSFQTPTALYSSIAGQPGYGTLFPAAGLGWPGTANTGPNSPFYRSLQGINNLSDYTNTASTGYLKNLGAEGNALIPNANSNLSAGYNTYNTLSPYIGQALTQGFDPQGQLYNKLFQQQQDQSNAVNAMSGVATTPYGASLTQQGNQNFDLAWQQQQLANQAQGANTAATLAGAGMGALGSGANNAATLLGSANQSIGTPINASQQQISDYLNYIMSNVNEGSAISGATNSATNAGAASTNSLVAAQQAANSGKGGIGSAFSGIGSLLGHFLPAGVAGA